MQSSIEAKQSFLRKQILEEGLDGNQFMMFLNKSNPKKGDDLDQYTLEQLSAIVEAFKPGRIKSEKESQQKKKSEPFISSPLKKSNPIDDSTYFESIQCQLKQINTIYKKNHKLLINIPRWQKVQGGFLQKSYVKFAILIPELDTRVYRRYSQFEWLKSILKLLYPGLPIPPLPKKGKVIRVEEKYLNKRMYLLQKFLNQLASMPQIASDILFQRFITVSEGKQFEKVKQLYSKVDNVPLRKIKTISGTINIGTEKQISAKVNKCFEYMNESQPEMKKIYKNFKGAATNFQQAADFFKGINSSCEFLQKKEQTIRNQLNLPLLSEKSSFFLLGAFAEDFAISLTAFAKTFRKEIYSLTKYQSFYKLNIIESIQHLNVMQQEYLQNKINLLKKKEKLYSEGKISKWGLKEKDVPKPATKDEAFEIMLPKETSEMTIQRQNYALFNLQIFEECFRHLRDFNTHFIHPLCQFLDLQVKISKTNSQTISQVATQAKQIAVDHLYT